LGRKLLPDGRDRIARRAIMSEMFYHRILKAVPILLAFLLLGFCFSPSSGAAEPDTQSFTNKPATEPTTPAQQQVQPEQKGTKTKLEPRDLLPSMLTPKPGTGSTAAEQSLLTRDRAQLRRLQSGNAQINQKMRQLNYSIQKMRTDINRTLRIRRQRY
jgi:hypothetical protein